MIKLKDLQSLSELIADEGDKILIDLCMQFTKKVESFGEIGISYVSEKDKFEFTTVIISIVRTYLISMREYYKEDEDSIKDIVTDLQGTLSSLFIIGKGKLPSLEFRGSLMQVENLDRQKEIYNMLAPFISFVETNIYNCMVQSYNKSQANWHSQFCELSAKASGIIKPEKKESDELPAIPSGISEKSKKPKKKKGDMEL